MDARRFQNLTPKQLAQLLDLGRMPDWSAGESAEILRHQLAAPLLPDLGRVPGGEASRLEALVRGRRGAESFERQLTFISPSVEILTAIKHFGRHFREVNGDPLRGMPATVLYYGAIAAALDSLSHAHYATYGFAASGSFCMGESSAGGGGIAIGIFYGFGRTFGGVTRSSCFSMALVILLTSVVLQKHAKA